MRHYSIYTPVLGLRKDWPGVLLDKAFTPDAQNIQYWNGEIRSAKMRRRHLVMVNREVSPGLLNSRRLRAIA